MSTFLRDQLQGMRINRLKARMRRAWDERQRAAEAGEHPVCPGCGKRHPPPGLAGLLRVLGGADEDEATPPPPAPSSLN